MIDSLKLSDETATAVVALAIEFETYSDDLPETAKDRIEAAHEVVTFAIDAYKNEGIRSDADDEDTAEAGEQVEAILKSAGVKIDDDGDVEYGKPLTGAKLQKILGKFDLELEDEDDDKGGDDEAAFEIDDIIEGYDELSPASRIKEIKKLKLDPDDEDDAQKLNDIADYEEDQDKPSSRVLAYLEELLGEEDGDDDSKDDAGDDDESYSEKQLMKMDKEDLAEVAEKFGVDFPKRLTEAGRKRTAAAILEAQESGGDDDKASDDADEEPWEGYDESSVKEIKAALTEAAEDEDEPLDADQVQYVVAYEKANENRGAVLKFLDSLLEEDDDEEPEAEEEETPKQRGRRGRRGAKSSDPDDSDDVDNAVAKDDAKESRRNGSKKVKITREQILEALDTGSVTLSL